MLLALWHSRKDLYRSDAFMQTPFTNLQTRDLANTTFGVTSNLADMTDEMHSSEQSTSGQVNPPVLFRGDYAGCMEMSADRRTVAGYLDDHSEWFLRCAHPMTAEPLGQSGYILTVGNFGALGYHVEPKVGLHLLPQDQGVYRIETVPVPDYVSHGYEVDFKASLQLNEVPNNSAPEPLTRVDWELELKVWVHFPRFILTLPRGIIQKTGDHLLSQIVRQVSRCLTHKVQEDFHQTLSLPLPESYQKRKHHFLERFSPQA